MKKRLLFLLYSGLFFLAFFMFFRFVFIMYQYQMSETLDYSEIMQACVSGFRHDLSLMGYIVLLSGILVSVSCLFKASKLIKFFNGFYNILVLVFMSILVPNLEIYRNWGFHFDSTVLEYLKTPKEAAASTLFSTYFILFSIFICSFILANYVIRRYVSSQLINTSAIKPISIPLFVLVSACMIIPVRGGFGIAPMNVGFVYFSNNSFANHIAVNPVWSFAYSMKTYKQNNKTFVFMDSTQIMQNMNYLHNQGTEQMQLTNDSLINPKPNVLVIMLESFTSKVIGCLGADYGATPNFDKLSKQGVLFTNFYGIGDRSKIGILGVLSGYPSLPQRSVISYTGKTSNIPSLCRQFTKRNYSSTFYYGGDVKFANMNSYIINTGFDNIVSMDNFDSDLYNSKWGVHDKYMLDYLLKDISREQKPFFKVLFTLSSHEPFDVPMETVIKGDSEDSRFLNSVYYTDKCIGDFISKFKKLKSWNNTIVIFVADHGTRYINNSLPCDLEKYKIPMLWIGGAVKYTDTKVDKLGCQPDLANSLLRYLNLSDDEFVMGKNLLDENQKAYAYFTYNNGFGYIDDTESSVFDFTADKYVFKNGNSSNNRSSWKTILQFLNKDFNER